jgi:EmrB/QacA subfamily drug resistance transporter
VTAPAVLKPTRHDPRWLPLAVTSIGSFMSILDSTIVNIALPDVLRDFHSNLANGQLVLTAYLMALAVVIPASGYLGERIGMKRLYMITLVLFTAGSALCGLSWNLQSLIGFRVLQGLGGGSLQPLGMAIVFTMITPLERGYFMGVLGLPVLLAPILGPSLGGYLVQFASWRMIFLINIPIGLLNLALAQRYLRETPRREGARFDTRGFALAAVAFPALLLGLSVGGSQGWTSPRTLALLIAGAAALGLFVRTELRHRDPLLQLRLFAAPMFTLAMALQFVAQFSLFGLSYLMPLFLQFVHGWGAAKTGLALLPMGLVGFVTMNVAGRLYNRVGPRPLVMTGLAIIAVATALLSRIDEHTGVVPIVLLLSCRGLAIGLCSQTVMTAAYNTVPQPQMARATSLVQVGMRIYGSLSAATLTTVLIVSLSWHGAPAGSSIAAGTAPVPAMLHAFSDAFLLMSAVTVVGLVAAHFLRDHALDAWQAQTARPAAPVDARESGERERAAAAVEA